VNHISNLWTSSSFVRPSVRRVKICIFQFRTSKTLEQPSTFKIRFRLPLGSSSIKQSKIYSNTFWIIKISVFVISKLDEIMSNVEKIIKAYKWSNLNWICTWGKLKTEELQYRTNPAMSKILVAIFFYLFQGWKRPSLWCVCVQS
jgi:hypothetical protein